MACYRPTEPLTAWLLVAVWLGSLASGFGITRLSSARLARSAAWLLVAASLAAMLQVCDREPAGVRMVAICASLLASMKAVVSVESQATGQPPLSALCWFAFAALWVGMRPAPFAKMGRSPLNEADRLIGRGLERLAWGVVCLLIVRAAWQEAPSLLPAAGALAAATTLGLIGLSLTLHFGFFSVAAGCWRLLGADCRPLFRAPLAAETLTEFWGRRWNLAFSEMMTLSVVRPLTPVLGWGGAVMAAFLFSGALHELAISVPVRAGYGGPLVYFVLQGALVLVEHRLARLGWPVERLGWLGRVWTLGWLALPLPILFHLAFIRGVVWPLLGLPPHS
jgi:Membrane bound O-acyl transferase family